MNKTSSVVVSAVLLTILTAWVACRAEDKEEKSKPVLCKAHSVPEDICVLCHPKLAKEFKNKADWCKEHKVPESQCFACHPELEAKFKAMAAGKKENR